MSKITLSSVTNPQDLTSLASTINSNSTTIVNAIDNTLSRDGTAPNQMQSSLDMNSNQILNLPAPGTVNSPARLIDVVTNPSIVVPSTGTSGHNVPYLDGNNTWSGTNTYSAATTFNGSVTFNGSITGLTIPGWNNVYSGKTADYTVVTGDNGKTLSASGGYATLTFGAASGYASNFVCMIRNADGYPGGRAKKIVMPGLSYLMLYPGQQVMVFNANNNWDYFPKNQRWVQSSVTFNVDSSGNDNNDGLGTGATGALATLQKAASLIWYSLDQAGGSAIISVPAGQTLQQQCNLGGQPVGSNVIFIQGSGGAFNWQSPVGGGSMLAIGDNAECIVQNINFISSNNVFGRAAIYLHNNGLTDVFSGCSFQGGGTNDVAIFLDNHACICTIANPITVSNTFASIVWHDNGGKTTVGGVISPSGATVVNSGLFTTKYRGVCIVGAQPTTSGWTSIGASYAMKGGLLDTNGTTIPGGTASTTGGLVL